MNAGPSSATDGVARCGQSVVSLSFFRFASAADRLWAFTRMQYARAPLAGLPGIGFFKLFGTGTRQSFHPLPNLSVYALLATWPDVWHARQQLAEAAIFRAYRAHAAEHWTVYLCATHSWGRWDGRQPFAVAAQTPPAATPAPIGVITRASIRPRRLLAFWRSVPDVSAAIASQDGVLFKMGMGEVPWLHQVTFSVWPDIQSMRAFAYRPGAHRQAIEQVRTGDWFAEELFARFSIAASEGSWAGRSPLGALSTGSCAVPGTAGAEVRAA